MACHCFPAMPDLGNRSLSGVTDQPRADRAGCQRWYHTYVEKTTVYFPAELKRAVSRYASRRGISEAEVIRQAVAEAVAGDEIPRPRGALFSSDVLMADDVDAHLDGFGLR